MARCVPLCWITDERQTSTVKLGAENALFLVGGRLERPALQSFSIVVAQKLAVEADGFLMELECGDIRKSGKRQSTVREYFLYKNSTDQEDEKTRVFGPTSWRGAPYIQTACPIDSEF